MESISLYILSREKSVISAGALSLIPFHCLSNHSIATLFYNLEHDSVPGVRVAELDDVYRSPS